MMFQDMATSSQPQEKAQSSASFSQEQLQEDICTLLLMEARKRNQLLDTSLGMAAIGLEIESDMDFWAYSNSASDLNLTYSKLKDTEFAKLMLDNYDFGLHAITGTRTEPMEHETLHTWLSAYLMDLSTSAYVEECEEWGVPNLKEAIKRCLYTLELSNARRVLEGNEPFYHFSRSERRDDDGATEGELTIRQMALLAGMEEMSLRSIISRKTAPVLEIRKQDRRTVIAANVAAEWLKAKGRYLPVKAGRRTADLDLSITQFRDIRDLEAALSDRLGVVNDRLPGTKDTFLSMLRSNGRQDLFELSFDDYGNADLMTAIAEVLELPPLWLTLRAKEAKLKSEIFIRSNQLDQVKQRLKQALQQEAQGKQPDSGALQ